MSDMTVEPTRTTTMKYRKNTIEDDEKEEIDNDSSSKQRESV